MKQISTLKSLVLVAGMLLMGAGQAWAGDGTKANPYTVAELNAQKDALAASGETVWVKADLKGLGEDGTKTDNATVDNVKQMAGLFGDATGNFVAYSWQILGELAMSDLTNTKDLLIALTYGTAGHPYGSSASSASVYEPETAHFSLAEVHGALSLEIKNGLRGYHITSSYRVPSNVIAVTVNAGVSNAKGAYVSYKNYDGADEAAHITPKNIALVLMANEGTYDFVLTSDYFEQPMNASNALEPGVQAGQNVGTAKNRYRLRFVSDVNPAKTGFDLNTKEISSVYLASKDEVYLRISSLENNFYGKWDWETEAKNWITWKGGPIFDFANNNLGLTYGGSGTADQQNAGDLAGKKLTLGDVTMTFVNAPSITVRAYDLPSKGKHFQIGAKNGKLRITADEGRAITKIEVTNNGTKSVKWEVDKGEGSLSEDMLTWEGNATSVRFNTTGATYINAIKVMTAPVNAETVTPAADVYTTEVSTLAELNALPAGTLVKLNLNNVIVTTEFANKLGYYIQDATAGTALYATTLNFNLNDVLNGYVYLNRADNEQKNPGNRVAMAEDINADNIQVTAGGTYSPVEGTTVATLNTSANICKVVQFNNVKVKGTAKTAANITDSEEGTIKITNPGNNFATSVYTEDMTNLNLENATVVGVLIATASSGNQIYPISITGTPAGIQNVNADFNAADVKIYNLQGVRLNQLQRGLNIVNGKKVVIK